MELLLFQLIFFIALIILAGLFAWREYVSAGRAKALSQRVAAQKRCLDSMRTHLVIQSGQMANIVESYAALKEYSERSREFSETASLSMDKLVREFEIVMSYRKEATQHYDGVEGL